MPRVAPYTVAVFRRVSAGTSAFREQAAEWIPEAQGVGCDIQSAGGGLEPTPSGQRAQGRRNAWFDTGTDLLEGDGIEVTAGPAMVGQRFIVQDVADWGEPGDLEAELTRTTEVFE